MFQEEIGDLTAKHLRTHINAYLAAVQTLHADQVKLQNPKAIETANLVGGVYNTATDRMPALAVDVLNKAYAGNPENLWLYNYEGHIAGVISALDEVTANLIIKRYEEAVETFIREHANCHFDPDTTGPFTSQLGSDFSIMELQFAGAAFSGAEELETVNDNTIWIAGFRIDLNWILSEAGPSNHA